MNDKTSNESIFQATQPNQSVILFDTQTIRDSWTPFAAGWRTPCGHYHDFKYESDYDDPGRWDAFPQESAVVFATNNLGVMAAIRVRNGEYVGIISMIYVTAGWSGVSVPDDINSSINVWVDNVMLRLT